MSKKKDPDSWKGRGEAYKNAKRAPIEDAPMPHVKKKKKKNKKSSHKHIYVPAIYHLNYVDYKGEKHHTMSCGSHCKICGRVNDMAYMWFHLEDRVARFKKENPDYVVIDLPDDWNYFRDKFIPL